MIEIPEPEQGEDFYLSELRRYTVSIDVEVSGFAEDVSESDMRSKATDGFRDGSLDGEATVVHSEKIKDVELDFETDLPFNRHGWLRAKMAERGLNENGDPLRPWEKTRPECEAALADFPSSPLAHIMVRVNGWCRRCRQAFLEAFGWA